MSTMSDMANGNPSLPELISGAAESVGMQAIWIPSSKCCRKGCAMTLCTPVGAGYLLCWLHVFVELPELDLPAERQ